MKTLPVLAILIALGAILLSPLSLALGGSLLVATGIGAIAFNDYARPPRSLAMPTVAAAVAARRSERFGLAA